MPDEAVGGGDGERALLDEGLKKGALVWLELAGREHPRWHVWAGDQIYLLTGPGEQPDPGLVAGSTVRVVVRSKDTRHRLLSFDADVSVLSPTDDDWVVATAELARTRLNLTAAETAPDRWAAGTSVIYRLTPRLPLAEGFGAADPASRRAAPVPTPATTAGPPPHVLHRRGHAGRPLS